MAHSMGSVVFQILGQSAKEIRARYDTLFSSVETKSTNAIYLFGRNN